MTITNLPAIILRNIANMLLSRMSQLSRAAAVHLMNRWILGAVLVNVALLVGLELVIAPVVSWAFGAAFVPAIPTARIMILAWGLLGMRFVFAAAAQAQGRAARASMVEMSTAVLLVLAVTVGALLGQIEYAAFGQLLVGALSCVAAGAQVQWRTEDSKLQLSRQSVNGADQPEVSFASERGPGIRPRTAPKPSESVPWIAATSQ